RVARLAVRATLGWGAKVRRWRHAGGLAGVVGRLSSNVKPDDRQRAGSTAILSPAASADRIMWRSASSTSPRESPSSRARRDTDRGSRDRYSTSCLRSVNLTVIH